MTKAAVGPSSNGGVTPGRADGMTQDAKRGNIFLNCALGIFTKAMNHASELGTSF